MTIAPRRVSRRRTLLALPAASVLLALFAAGCGSSSSPGSSPSASASPAGGSSNATIDAVGAENEYANVIEQIGGNYVKVTAIESNPNTDPHTFEASPSVAQAVSAASLLIENGVGYDTYMEKIEAASGDPIPRGRSSTCRSCSACRNRLRTRTSGTSRTTMPAVAKALVSDLSALQPAHAAYFQANATKFDASLKPWYAAIAKFRGATRTRRSRRPSRSATTCSKRPGSRT